MSVAPVGDVNGDGVGDIILGDQHFPHMGFSTQATGAVAVLSGVDGTPDFAASGPWWGDPSLGMDGSGFGFIRAYSGVDLSVIFEVFGTGLDRLGLGLAGMGDLNGDGFSEIGASLLSFSSTPGVAGARVYSAGGVRRYGVGLGGLQTLDADWMPAPAGDRALGSVVCTGGQPGGAGLLGVSLGEADASVMGVPVLIDPNSTQLFFTSPFVFDGTGSYSASAFLRVPSAAGLLVRAQFFDLAPPFGSSNGLEFLLLP